MVCSSELREDFFVGRLDPDLGRFLDVDLDPLVAVAVTFEAAAADTEDDDDGDDDDDNDDKDARCWERRRFAAKSLLHIYLGLDNTRR